MDVEWPPEPRHEGLVPWYRLGVYSLGNNVRFHRDLYRFACGAPGLIVLHDLALDDFVRGMKVEGDPLGFVAEREAERLAPNLHSEDVLRNEPLRMPWAGHVLRRSRGVIVHSDFGRRYVEELGSRTPVFVVPHPVVESDADMERARRHAPALRAPLEARGARTVIVAPGDLNEAKQLGALLAAARLLPEDVHVVMVGRRIEGYDADREVAASGLGGRVTLAPDVSDDDFRGWLCAADVAVDLRFPHRGEVSGSLARAMQAGLPAVVSATGTYLDVPDELVLRVAPGPTDPSELAAQLRLLIDDEGLRVRMGAAARDHVEERARLGGHRARVRAGDRGDPPPGPRSRPEGRGPLVRRPRRHRRRRARGPRRLRRRVRAGARELPGRSTRGAARIAIGASPAGPEPVARLGRAR